MLLITYDASICLQITDKIKNNDNEMKINIFSFIVRYRIFTNEVTKTQNTHVYTSLKYGLEIYKNNAKMKMINF